MQFFIAIEGEKEGPLSIYQVTELLRDGRITGESLGWHQSLDAWAPLQEIAALDSTLEALRALEATEDERKEAAEAEANPPSEVEPPPSSGETPKRKLVLAHEVRPFTRFWARGFDYLIVITGVWLAAGLPPPQGISAWEWIQDPKPLYSEEEAFRLQSVTLAGFAIWHVIEAILLHAFGTTPGKALFSIRVTEFDGRRPSLGKALGRSFYVWLAGAGLLIFPFNLIAMTLGFFRLLSTGMTLWDKHLRFHVQHAPMGPGRIVLAVAAFAVLMAVQNLIFS